MVEEKCFGIERKRGLPYYYRISHSHEAEFMKFRMFLLKTYNILKRFNVSLIQIGYFYAIKLELELCI